MAVLSSTLTTIADNYSRLSIGCDLWWEGAGLWGSMGSSGMGVWGHEQDVIWVERWQSSRQSQLDIPTWTVLASAECLDSDYNSDFLHRHRWWVLSAVQSTFIPWIRLYALNMFLVLTKFYSVCKFRALNVLFCFWVLCGIFCYYKITKINYGNNQFCWVGWKDCPEVSVLLWTRVWSRYWPGAVVKERG